MSILIHIGYHKTATTWLQRHFFSNSEMFVNLADYRDVDRFIVRPHPMRYDLAAAKTFFKERHQALQPGDVVEVISSEDLCGNPHTGGYESAWIPDRLKALFPDAKILIVVRRQADAILSLYRLYVRFGGRLDLRRWLSRSFYPGYYGFDHQHLQYDILVARYTELFGADRVCVLPYEWFDSDARGFCQAILEFADSPRLEPGELAFDRLEGRSSAGVILPLKRVLNVFVKSRLIEAPVVDLGGFGKFVMKALDWAGKFSPPAVERRIAHRDLAVIDEFFSKSFDESNRRLARLANIDLDKWGYSMAPPSDDLLDPIEAKWA